MNIGAARRNTFGRKQIRQFRQGRVNARKYLAQQKRMISARSRRLQKKLETSFRKDLRIIISQVKAGVTPSFGASVARKEREIEATVRSETRKLFNTVVEINDAKYERVFTKQVDLGFGFSRPEAVARWTNEFIQNREIIFAGISQSMTRKILDDIQELDAEGIGVDALARQINRKYSGINRRRAALIARTETHNAAGYGQHNYHKSLSSDLGVSMVKQWVATLDARTRSSHAQMNGTQVSMDEPFMMPNGREMQYVGDPDGGAANVINCRCAIVYIDADDDVEDSKDPPPSDDLPTDDQGRPLGLDNIAMQKKYGALSGTALTSAIETSKNRITRTVKDNSETWGELKDTVRFYGGRGKREYGVVQEEVFGEKADSAALFAIDEITQELNALADLLGVKKIRGYKAIKRRGAVADMGDGVMGLSTSYLRKIRKGKFENKDREPSTWKFGDDVRLRPFTSDEYLTSWVDDLRSTMYHEFGHVVHQTFKVNRVSDYYDPPLEKWLKGKRLRGTGATRYADANGKEWFAENFSLWAKGRDDLVSPRFLKVINLIKAGEMPDGKT